MGVRDLDALIGNLTSELCPVQCLGHPFRCAVMWVGLTVIYEALVVMIFGLRPDIALKIADLHFLFETGLVLAVGLSAAMASAWLCIPDMRGLRWLAALPISGVAIFFFWAFLNLVTGGDVVSVPHLGRCFASAALSSLVPMAALVFMMRRGSTTSPVLSGVMNILAVGCAGYVGLRLICTTEGIGHDLAYHVFPFMLLGAVIGLFARWIYRW